MENGISATICSNTVAKWVDEEGSMYAKTSSSKKLFCIGISVDMTNLLIGSAAFLLKSSYLTIKDSSRAMWL